MDEVFATRQHFGTLGGIFVDHPRFAAAFRRVQLAVQLGGSDDEGPCLQLSGPPGVRKSTIKKKILVEYPRLQNGRSVRLPRSPPIECDHVPVLAFDMPPKPTVKSIVREGLKKIGDPDWASNNDGLLTDRFDRFLEACGTQAVLIDESHRAVDRGGTVIASDIAEWLTARHTANPISLVLTGLGRVKHLFSEDLQLARRWDAEFRLEPYRWLDEVGQPHPDQDSFAAVLDAFAELSPVLFDGCVDPQDDVVVYRFFYASRGVIGLLKSVLKRTVRIMGEEGLTAPITLALLERAYDDAIRGELRTALNPFSARFKPDLRVAPPALPDDRLALLSPEKRRLAKSRKARNDVVRAMLQKG